MATALTVNLTYRPNLVLVEWPNLVASETGDAAEYAEYNDKTVTITGVFGGAVTIEGSFDGTTYIAAKDANTGSAISATSNAAFVVKENFKYIRPVAAAGVTGVKVGIVGTKGSR